MLRCDPQIGFPARAIARPTGRAPAWGRPSTDTPIGLDPGCVRPSAVRGRINPGVADPAIDSRRGSGAEDAEVEAEATEAKKE